MGCKAKSTFVHLTLAPGQAVPSGIKTVELALALGSQTATTTLREADGKDISFPTDTTLQIGSGSGSFTVVAVARNAAGKELDRGTTTATIAAGALTEVTVPMAGGKADLEPSEPSHDFGRIKQGQSSAIVNLGFINAGYKPTGPLAVTLGGMNASAFSLTNDTCSGRALDASKSCSITVTFRPGAALGAMAATVTVTGDPGGTAVEPVTGTGIEGTQTLTVVETGTGVGTVTSTPPNISCGGPNHATACAGDFAFNGTVALTASAATGSTFAGWSGACTSDPCSVLLDQARTVTAQFNANPEVLTVALSGPTGAGVVSADKGAISCGASGGRCSDTYLYGATVTLNAAPANGLAFLGWSGACSNTSGPCAVLMSQAQSVTATFAPDTLTLNVSGPGGGLITSNPGGINCSDNGDPTGCAHDFNYPGQVILTAIPPSDGGSRFALWTGACASTSPASPCTVTMDQAKTVGAVFNPQSFPLAVAISGMGAGTVTSNVQGLNCASGSSSGCSAPFPYHSSVVLTAAAPAGSVFTGWSSNCTPISGNQCTYVMGAGSAQTVTASFSANALAVKTIGAGTGTVTSSPPGINCTGNGGTCGAPFKAGDSVVLTATASTGSTFAGWSGACTNPTGTCTVVMNGSQSVSATFTLNTYVLSVQLAGPGTGTVTSSPGGITCTSGGCSASYNYNTQVTLTAAPSSGMYFAGWTGGCATVSGNSCTASMVQAQSVTANFGNNTLAVSIAGSGAGTVTSSPAGINCAGASGCSAPFDAGTSVVLTAAPAAGSTFAGWKGACSNATGTCTVTMSQQQSVIATFTLNSYALSVSLAGASTGAGTITSNPAGINCTGSGSGCSASYSYPTTVVLTATAATGSTFKGWSGACSNSSGTCTVSMTQAQSVAANFNLNSYALSVALGGAGAGVVVSNPAGINCGSTCSAFYIYNTQVTLTATPSNGMYFAGWTGCPSAAGTSCTVSMTQTQNVGATFGNNTLTVTSAGTGSGSVTSSPAGINCAGGAGCSAAFNAGTSVVLSASPAASSNFAGWSGACNNSSGTCTVTMSQAQAVTATFTLKTVVLTGSVVGSGTVSTAPSGFTNCSANCSATFDYGTAVSVTATPAAGSAFTGWSNACTNPSGPCNLNMTAAATAVANFTPVYTVTVARPGVTGASVVSSPAGINCSATAGSPCSASFTAGTNVTLTANPGSSARFAAFSGDCTGASCAFPNLGANKNVIANFVAQHLLTLSIAGTGSGTVSDGAGLSCASSCSKVYDAGTVVALTETVSTGTFAGWGGACNGFTCSVTMNADQAVSAAVNTSPCAAGVNVQNVTSIMSGCYQTSGGVPFANRAKLCAPGCRVATASEWVANRGQTAPTHHYWTDDSLGYSIAQSGSPCGPAGCGPNSCYVTTSTINAGSCGSSTSMRVCSATSPDPSGNTCNWTGCGFNSTTPNQFFGGCGADSAGSICVCGPTWVADAVNGSDTNPGNGGLPFRTLTRALAAASSGQQVTARPGTYDSSNGETFPITIPPGVILVGDEASGNRGTNSATVRIVGAGTIPTGPAANFSAAVNPMAGSMLAGFYITGSGSGIVPGSDGTFIRNNTVDGTSFGVFIRSTTNHTLTGNLLTNTSSSAIATVNGTAGGKAENNSVLYNGYGVEWDTPGIDFGGGPFGSIGNNTIACNRSEDVYVQGGVAANASNNTWNHAPPSQSVNFATGLDIFLAGANAAVTTAGYSANPVTTCPSGFTP